MKKIVIKCPAKINLTLEIINKREDGFHNIKSIMQMINLYDYLTINIKPSDKNEITLSGNCAEIPYDEKNLVYKATDLFLKTANLNGYNVEIYIEKNIPLSAGLAGGSTDAAGTFFGLNELFNKVLSHEVLEKLCAQLGSDLNVCLNGGCTLATSRGEITQKLPNLSCEVTLIKPRQLGISAGEAYKKYANLTTKPQNNMTEKMLKAIDNKENIEEFLYNDLELAVFNDYKELQEIKSVYPKSIMSGSGSTYFVLENLSESLLDKNYEFINNLKFISNGVEIVK